MLRQAHTVIATSAPYLASSDALRSWQEKSTVIPLGIAAERVPAPQPAALQWAHQQWSARYPLRVLTVGRLTYYKGHAQLIQAIAQLPDAQLCIVGAGEQYAELSRLITQLNLTDRVQLLGFRPAAALTALLSTCDVFCLPSLERTEAFGVVLLEAMRYQCAIIASAIPGAGVNWIIDANQTGLLVPPNDITALAQALQHLQQQPDFRRQLAIQAQRKFQAHFAIEPVAELITACYLTI
jgi:rhamnosyl/mannosyltransferase